jgi:hypothetical protein
VCKFGRSTTSRGRIPRECSTPIQAQGATGRYHQGGQAPLLLPEARREKACEGRAGSQARAQENAQRTGLTQQRAAPSRGGSARSGPHHVELQQGFHTQGSSRHISISFTHAPFQGRGRAESKGQSEGGVVDNLHFRCSTAVLSPRVGARKRAEGSHPQWNFRTRY